MKNKGWRMGSVNKKLKIGNQFFSNFVFIMPT